MKALIDWKLVLQEVRSRLKDDQTFEAWFKPIVPTDFKREKDGTLKVTLKTPDTFFQQWFQRNFSEILESSIKSFWNGKVVLKYEVSEEELFFPEEEEEKIKETKRYGFLFGRLEKKFTFDTFVVGKSNEFAYGAALAVANAPGERYNPLFIYGGVGLGKTHLLNAIGNHILSNPSNRLRVCCITASEFMNAFIKASFNNQILEFQNFYQTSFDVLLVDDIHYLEGNKAGTQEQFFHLFNVFFNARKQIVITSDKYPQNLSGVQERLKNRFEQGLIVDIKPPEYETKVAIVKKKALIEHNFHLPEEYAHYIVQLVNADNVRKLEGALTRVLAYVSLKGGEISKEIIDEALSGYITERKRVTPNEIIELVAKHYNVKAKDIKSSKRTKYIAFPRQIAMYLCRDILKLSYPEIGHWFGGKDHTTVIHSVNKIKKLLEKDPEMRELVENFKKRLK